MDGAGSGVVGSSDGLILTAAHVIGKTENEGAISGRETASA